MVYYKYLNMVSKIEISHKTIIFTFLLLLASWFIWQIRDILLFLFIAFIITSAIRPMVDWMEKRRIPRFLAIILVYILLFGVVGLSIAGVIPVLAGQITHLMQDLPVYVERMLPYWNLNLGQLSQQLAPIGQNILKVTINLFSNMITVITLLVFVFYFLLEQKNTERSLAGFMGEESAKRMTDIVMRIEQRLGMWVQSQIILMFIIGVLSYIGLVALHIDFALPLAILAGLFEIVPNVGPIVSSIPAIIIALAISPVSALSVTILFVVIHQVEGNLIVPLIMKKSVGLSPLITIFALLVGGKIAGIAGAILAVPLVLIVQEIISSYLMLTKK
jgi:predicted PurR-regulated permease PerM